MHHFTRKFLLTNIIVFLICFTAPILRGESSFPTPPESVTETVTDTLHGVIIEDPYRWLEDQESPATRDWIRAQNEYTRSIVDSLPYRDRLAERFSQLLKTDRVSTPSERKGRFFLYKRGADQDQYSLYMREGLDGQDRLLIDPASIDPELMTSVGMTDISDDGTIMAYTMRHGGEDETSIRLLNVDTGEELADAFGRSVYFGFAITTDNKGVYFARREENGSMVYYHEFGTNAASDKEIFGDGYGPESSVGCEITPNGKYLILSVYHGSAGNNEYFFQDLTVGGAIIPLTEGIEANFDAQFAEDLMILETNWEAPNGRILAIDLNNPSRKSWRELIPEAKAVIKSFSAAGGRIFVNYLEDVISRVHIYELNGNHLGEISFPSLGSVGHVYGKWESNHAFFSFQSYYIPRTIYHYDVASDEQTIFDRQDLPVDPEKFIAKQVWYASKDGTKIPMFILHKKGLQLDGANPTLLYGYGGFRVSMTPYFNIQAVVFAEHGGVYAVPAIRGGGEFGEMWHEAAMLEKKQNSFDDFIAAAEWLCDNGYTNSSKLAIRGGSNGGLLVGAVMNQRPDLCRTVICTYPLLDMLRYQDFLMGKYWVSEYGSADNRDHFDFIYKYSPYHNVKTDAGYPSVMFVTGDSDTRVAPLHARKMTALLQALKGSESPVLLLYDTEMGHSGGMPVSKAIVEKVDENSFLFWQLGIK